MYVSNKVLKVWEMLHFNHSSLGKHRHNHSCKTKMFEMKESDPILIIFVVPWCPPDTRAELNWRSFGLCTLKVLGRCLIPFLSNPVCSAVLKTCIYTVKYGLKLQPFTVKGEKVTLYLLRWNSGNDNWQFFFIVKKRLFLFMYSIWYFHVNYIAKHSLFLWQNPLFIR